MRVYKTSEKERARRMARYFANPEKAHAQTARWRKANPDRVRESYWRSHGYPAPTRPRPTACELCGFVPDIPTGRKGLQLDHCHATKRFRGWLCHKCNKALGLLSDNPTLLRRAADYLDRQAG